jgi:hypothetical protein
MAFGNALVATAKSAQTLAKRQVNVQTNPFGSIAFGKTL